MTQIQLDRAVAAATGESVAFIAGQGFQHHVMPSRELIRSADRLLRFRQSACRKKRTRAVACNGPKPAA